MPKVSQELLDRIAVFEYIDTLVEGLDMFFRLKLESTGLQTETDSNTIKSLCRTKNIDPIPFENYYNREVEKRYLSPPMLSKP